MEGGDSDKLWSEIKTLVTDNLETILAVSCNTFFSSLFFFLALSEVSSISLALCVVNNLEVVTAPACRSCAIDVTISRN